MGGVGANDNCFNAYFKKYGYNKQCLANIYCESWPDDPSIPQTIGGRTVFCATYTGLYRFAFVDSMRCTNRLRADIGCVEATPVIYERKVWVASRNGYLFCLGEKPGAPAADTATMPADKQLAPAIEEVVIQASAEESVDPQATGELPVATFTDENGALRCVDSLRLAGRTPFVAERSATCLEVWDTMGRSRREKNGPGASP